MKRASRADPEAAFKAAATAVREHGASAADVAQGLASRVAQQAQHAAPDKIVRQTQQAAEEVFSRTQGIF